MLSVGPGRAARTRDRGMGYGLTPDRGDAQTYTRVGRLPVQPTLNPVPAGKRPLSVSDSVSVTVGHIYRGVTTMKKILVALVLALGVATVVGCSGGSPSGSSTTTKKS